jgi:hypothetical protein
MNENKKLRYQNVHKNKLYETGIFNFIFENNKIKIRNN